MAPDNPNKKQPMAKCAVCGKFISAPGAATCGLCPSMYHRACVSISETASLSKDWTCPDCKSKKTRKGSLSQDAAPTREAAVPPREAAAAATACPLKPGDASLALVATNAAAAAEGVRELRRELADYAAQMVELRREVAESRVIAAGVAARMEGFEQRLEVLESREAAPSPVGEVTVLERTVAQLRQELSDRDQEALLSDLEIGHLPEEKGENVVHAVTVLAARLGVALDERDIVFAERVGAAAVPARVRGAGEGAVPRERRIVVRMARRHLRDELLHAARVRRTLTANDAGRADVAPHGRIFLNERLTRANRQLFHRVREECRRIFWRFSWTKRGKIYARKADGEQAHHIRTEADLVRVFGCGPV